MIRLLPSLHPFVRLSSCHFLQKRQKKKLDDNIFIWNLGEMSFVYRIKQNVNFTQGHTETKNFNLLLHHFAEVS